MENFYQGVEQTRIPHFCEVARLLLLAAHTWRVCWIPLNTQDQEWEAKKEMKVHIQIDKNENTYVCEVS